MLPPRAAEPSSHRQGDDVGDGGRPWVLGSKRSSPNGWDWVITTVFLSCTISFSDPASSVYSLSSMVLTWLAILQVCRVVARLEYPSMLSDSPMKFLFFNNLWVYFTSVILLIQTSALENVIP